MKSNQVAHTPGPWSWFGNTKYKNIYLATNHSGRRYVLSFLRWGMQSAQPYFQGDDGFTDPATEFVEYQVSYRKDIVAINHPDAHLIAASPDLYKSLKEVLRDPTNIEVLKHAAKALEKAEGG